MPADPGSESNYFARLAGTPLNATEVIDDVRHWLSSMVIGLGLCPFADPVFKTGRIRFALSESNQPEDLLTQLADELKLLENAPREEIETTLLIAPAVYPDFLDFNDFLGVAEEMVNDLGLTGTVQIVGFHPKFQFAGAQQDAAENYTNRSPHPLLHLLREDSISEVASRPEELLEIPRRNSRTLQQLGIEKILQRLKRP
jgi:uncharacterized protein